MTSFCEVLIFAMIQCAKIDFVQVKLGFVLPLPFVSSFKLISGFVLLTILSSTIKHQWILPLFWTLNYLSWSECGSSDSKNCSAQNKTSCCHFLLWLQSGSLIALHLYKALFIWSIKTSTRAWIMVWYFSKK